MHCHCRLLRNRVSAQQARERKKNYVQTLEERNQLQVRSNHPLQLLVQSDFCAAARGAQRKQARTQHVLVLEM